MVGVIDNSTVAHMLLQSHTVALHEMLQVHNGSSTNMYMLVYDWEDV